MDRWIELKFVFGFCICISILFPFHLHPTFPSHLNMNEAITTSAEFQSCKVSPDANQIRNSIKLCLNCDAPTNNLLSFVILVNSVDEDKWKFLVMKMKKFRENLTRFYLRCDKLSFNSSSLAFVSEIARKFLYFFPLVLQQLSSMDRKRWKLNSSPCSDDRVVIFKTSLINHWGVRVESFLFSARMIFICMKCCVFHAL